MLDTENLPEIENAKPVEPVVVKPGLGALLAEIGDENEDRRKISCERIFPHDAAGFLESVAYAEFSVEWLQGKHGGGKYRMKLLDEQGRIREQRTCVILGEPKSFSKTQAIEAKPLLGETPFDKMLALMAAENAAANARHMQLIEILAKKEQPVDGQRTMRETLKTFAMIQDVFGGAGAAAEAPAEGGFGMSGTTEKLLMKAMDLMDKPKPTPTPTPEKQLPENQGSAAKTAPIVGAEGHVDGGPSARDVGLWLARQGEDAVAEATKAVFEKLTDEQKQRLAMSIMC
jgi:hypothetical protein